MDDTKSEAEMPTGSMEEAESTGAMQPPAKKAGRKSQATTPSKGELHISDTKPEAEMPSSTMEEAAPTSAIGTPMKVTLENAAEVFRATANTSNPEFLGAIRDKSLAVMQPHLAAAPPLGKMPGEPDVKPMEHGGKMPGEE